MEFTFVKGLPGAPERYLVLPILPKHAFLRDGVFMPCKDPDMAIGSGPLRLISAKEGSNLVRFGVFENYHGKPARLSPLMNIILDENGRMAKLQTGGADFVAEVAPDQISLFQNEARTYDLIRYPSYSFESIALNFDNPIIAGNRVLRQAMMHAIDRATILDRIYGGEGSVINGPFTPALACQCAESNPYPYDIDKAMKMIGDIKGFALGADKMWTLHGKPVRFRFISYVPPGQGQKEKVVQAIQNNFRDIGIGLDVKILDHEAEWQRTVFEAEDFDMALVSWEYDWAGMVGDLFHSRGMKQVGNYNFIDYVNRQVDRIIEAYEAATDRFQRTHCCNDLDKALNEDLPYLFLWTTKNNAVFNVHARDYRMVRITPLTIYDTIGEWYSQPK
jgi:peptide/nickel transport system substrate-binding protein